MSAVLALPCDRCGEVRELTGDVCTPCLVGAEAAAVADLTQAEHRRSQAALEAWLGVESGVPAGGA